jgi:hypothetical protein
VIRIALLTVGMVGCGLIGGADALHVGDCVTAECLDGGTPVTDDGSQSDSTSGERDDGSSADAATADVDLDVYRAPRDAPADVPPSSCGAQFWCAATQTCVSACQGCASGILECAATSNCLAACSACPSAPADCYQCVSGPVGKCTPLAGCTSGQFNGCKCASQSAAVCPGPTQTCVLDVTDYECHPCGSAKSNGKPCQGGGNCDAVTGTCH